MKNYRSQYRRPEPDIAQAHAEGYTVAVTAPFRPHEHELRDRMAAELRAKGIDIRLTREGASGMAIYRKPGHALPPPRAKEGTARAMTAPGVPDRAVAGIVGNRAHSHD